MNRIDGWAMASAGMNEHDALRMATIIGPEPIGLDRELGSIELSRHAGSVILQGNPIEDLRDANRVERVMSNDRLYDADTLGDAYPRERPFHPYDGGVTIPWNVPVVDR